MNPLLRFVIVAALLLGGRAARADAILPSAMESRQRTCCAFAEDLPLHLGSAHMPVSFGIVTGPRALGPHSYSGLSTSRESNGIIFTRRGGFIDTGHMREWADLTARLSVELRPLLARGQGTFRLRPRDGDIEIHVVAPVAPEALASTASLVARRVAFQISIWVEITQHYGHTVMRGAEEYFSSFTPEDLYSNLFGTELGAAALASPLPYDRALDLELSRRLKEMEATPSTEAKRVLRALDGRWWRKGTPWPAPSIPIAHSFAIGPHVTPMLPPPDVVPPASPMVLDVPEVDGAGAPLRDLYRLQIVPDLRSLPAFADAGITEISGDDLPVVVDGVARAIQAGNDSPGASVTVDDEHGGALAHYLVGLRLFDLGARGGIAAPLSGAPLGVFGGSLLPLRGDTRGGDFALMRLDVNHTSERGLSAGVAFFRSEALFFCHDRERGTLRAPLLSLLGPCAGGEWLGIGGSIAEGFHDGRTGRTALRPISLYGVLNPFGNGQSPSYDGLRLLLRGGGAIEHVWTEGEGGHTIPRLSANAVFLARTARRSLELRGATGYRLDPTTPNDAGFESDVGVRWYFLLGARYAASLADGVDPWGIGSIGLEGSHSFWTRPAHSYADVSAPFVSAEQSGTWQLLLSVTLGFEGLTF
jgi:hypothetical protein